MQVLALFVLLVAQVAADLPTRAIAAAKQALVADVDPTLSSQTVFEEWLEDLVGPSAEIAWEATDCGEQTGDPAIDAGRDIPLCVEARVTFPDRRTLSLSIMVGTWRSGVGGTPRFRFGVFDDASGRTTSIDSLAQVPAALGGSPPVRAGSTLSTPRVITRVAPELPEAARRMGVTGPVLLQVRIDERGRVADVPRVVRGHPALNAAAERAVRQWTFEPHVFEGRSVSIVMTLLVSFAQPSAPQTNDAPAGIGVLFAAHGGIGLRPVPLPPELETEFVVIVVEIDSPREQRGVAVTDVQLRGADGSIAMARRIVEVEEFVRVRGEEGECAYWLNPGGTRPWNGTLPAGRTRLRVRASLAEEPPSVAVSQLVIRFAVGSLVAEGPVQCRWPT